MRKSDIIGGFRPQVTCSAEGRELASRLWSFLAQKANVRISPKENLDNWAVVFDDAIKRQSYELVSRVLNFYMYRYDPLSKDHCFLVCNPNVFIDKFNILFVDYYWNTSPVPYEDIARIMERLDTVRWLCPRDRLIASVGRSFHNVCLYHDALDVIDLTDHERQTLHFMIYDTADYVADHYFKWSEHQTSEIWRAIIDFPTLLGLVYQRMMNYGHRWDYSQRIVDDLRAVMIKNII